MIIHPSTLPLTGIEKLVKFSLINNVIEEYTTNQDRIFGSIVHEMLKKFIDDKNILDEEAAKKWAIPHIKALDKGYINRLEFILWSYNRNKTIKDIKEIYKEESMNVRVGNNEVRGRIDKIITTHDNCLYIIDYKTTLRMKSINDFRGQAKCYQFLLEKAGFVGYKKVFFGIHYLDFNFIDLVQLKMDTDKIEYILMNTGS